MMKSRITLKRLCAFMASALLLLCAMPSQAQNVTISPQNGSMICALTGSDGNNQLGFQIGAFGTWRHNQLSLTMTGSNYKDLTEDGQLSQHSNHFITGDNCTFSPADDTRTPSRYIVADWGGSNLNTGYITIALPKGYRFTGYTFHISHDVSSFGQNNTAFRLTTNTNVSMTETNNEFSGNKNRVTLAGSSAAVSEFKRTGDDMGNVLYFTTSANSNGFYAVTFRYIELTFTADADASISLLPGSQVSTGASLLEVPFNTGKVDLGEIKPGSYNGATRVSYQFNTVTDMPANMLLYEEESVKDGTGFDGTAGKVAYNQTGHSITTVGQYFKFAPDATKGEQVYYLETPVSAMMSGNIENPVQFRITGATINYTNEASESFYIQYTDGGTTYYLGTNGQFSRTSIAWKIDSDGHIFSGNDYLTGTNSWVNVTQTKNSATTFTISGTTITNASGNTLKYFNYGGTRYGYFTNSTTLRDYWDTYNVYPAEVEYAEGSSIADYTIYVYDKEGKNPKEIKITGTGSYPLPDLNNDAIKFGVKGGDVALLNFTLKLQALNPYIDQMTVVLNDNDDNKNIRQTRTFTADDFSVGGGTFRFYLPTDCIHDYITITFEDLYSKYGDDTYDHTGESGTNSSRYNFVKSQHNAQFTNDNIYNAIDEAGSDQKESERISKKENVRTQVGTVGNIAFRFNNADELSSSTGYLTEYPFTLSNYENQTNPGKGEFIIAEFNADQVDETLHDKTFYVFTTDETRYNIAPTTATQHRFYAFYAMKVEVICQDYEPKVKFEKIYNETYYENGKEDAFYGAIVSAPGIESPLASDVATYKAISKAISNKKDDFEGTDVPTNLKQILYLDMSSLNGVYHSTASEDDADYAVADFNALKAKFATNALVFLPTNATDKFDNFAYAKKGEVAGSFQSANNIILTDKQPFYSPYTIQVDAANYATYSRTIPVPPAGEEKNVTLMLPFTLNHTGGVHTNENGVPGEGQKFTVNTMEATNTLSREGINYGNAYFMPITTKTTEANKPYMIKIDKNDIDENAEKIVFTVSQKGSSIVKTPELDEVPKREKVDEAVKEEEDYGKEVNICTGSLIAGDNTTGTYSIYNSDETLKYRKTYSFTNYASYSGNKYDRAVTEDVFYFGETNNKYVDLHTLSGKYRYLYVHPFRGVFFYTATVEGDATGAKFMKWLNICYGENPILPGETTAIKNMPKWADLMLRTGKRTIILTATKDQTVSIYGMNGVKTRQIEMNAGESQVVTVPSGVYVVNGTKIVVR